VGDHGSRLDAGARTHAGSQVVDDQEGEGVVNHWPWVRWVGVVACALSWVALAVGNDALWNWAATVTGAVCAYGVAIVVQGSRRV